MNRVVDGPSCSGCGLPNYEGLCPHCRGEEQEWREMWGVDREEGDPAAERVADSHFFEERVEW